MSADSALPRSLPVLPAAILGGLTLIGFGAFAWLAGSAESSARAYRAFLQNFLLWSALAQGALMLSAGMRLTNGRWAGPVHRLVDSLAAFVPVSIVLYLVLWTGRHELFEWMEHPEHVEAKAWWYREGFMFNRDLFALLWMGVLSCWYLYLSVRPMLGAARTSSTGLRGRLVSVWTSGWRGEDAERSLADRRCRKLAAVLALSYVFAYSTLGVDLVMGLSPEWISTMFPAYYAWGGFLSAVSMTALLAVLLRNSSDLRGQVTEARRHDLGKMVFAFSIFWMYLFWSQYLVIWYGNIPEETEFLAFRLGSQFLQDTWDFQWSRLGEPYVALTLTAWALCWVVPFWVLLGQKPKKTPAILGVVALGSVVGFWLERFILVTPSLIKPEQYLELQAEGVSVTPFGGTEIVVTLGFVGLFFLCFLMFARVFPGALPPAASHEAA